MKQLGLTDARLFKRSKKTRKEQFLEEMDTIIPWQRLFSTIEPFHPKATRGRRRIPLETMLSIYLLQHFFNYSDPAMEEALYKVRYWGLFKNGQALTAKFSLANLYMVRRSLLAIIG